MPSKHVAIVGGGMAGLAAACSLAERSIKTTLFEAAPQLGGRTRRVEYKGLKLDNGQHILLGAYRETLRLLKLASVDESKVLQRLPLALNMRSSSTLHSVSLSTCRHLPAPFHLLFGFMFAKGLPLKSRVVAIKLMCWLKLQRFKLAQDVPLSEFLQSKGQTPALIDYLWEPLCLAALNTPIEQASAQVFCNVLRDSFAKKKQDSDLLLPRVDLSTLLAEPLSDYLTAHGGEIKLNHVVQKIQNTTLTIKDENLTFSHVIIACAPHQLDKLGMSNYPFSYQPITTIYLQYAEDVKLPQAMVGLVDGISQWVFDRGQLCGQAGLVAVIISAHAPFEITQVALAEKVSAELAVVFPHLNAPIWHKVITEKRATFSCEPALARPIVFLEKNVYLAGDYVTSGDTYSDYPATIESAVRSGIAAAAYISTPLSMIESTYMKALT